MVSYLLQRVLTALNLHGVYKGCTRGTPLRAHTKGPCNYLKSGSLVQGGGLKALGSTGLGGPGLRSVAWGSFRGAFGVPD